MYSNNYYYTIYKGDNGRVVRGMRCRVPPPQLCMCLHYTSTLLQVTTTATAGPQAFETREWVL